MEGTEADTVRHTAVDGIEAKWHATEQGARIRSVSQSGRVLKTYGPDYPDLTEARDLWPRMTPLWDAVRDAVQDEP